MTKHDEAVEALKDAEQELRSASRLLTGEGSLGAARVMAEAADRKRDVIASLSTARGEEPGEFQRLYNSLQTAHNELPADGDYHVQGARRIIRAWMVEVQAWAYTQLDHPPAPGEHAALIARARKWPAAPIISTEIINELADALEGKPKETLEDG